MTVTTYPEQITEWKNKNPLRMWRTEQGWTLGAMASACRVSILAVQHWESGANRPNVENAKALRRVTGVDIIGQIINWEKQRPSFEG